MLGDIKRVISQWGVGVGLSVSNSGPGPLEPGARTLGSDQGDWVLTGQEGQPGSPAPPAPHRSQVPHLELASGALPAQEVLTLHDSLTAGPGFLGKGDEGRSYAGGWG